jgi:hypothetical protein
MVTCLASVKPRAWPRRQASPREPAGACAIPPRPICLDDASPSGSDRRRKAIGSPASMASRCRGGSVSVMGSSSEARRRCAREGAAGRGSGRRSNLPVRQSRSVRVPEIFPTSKAHDRGSDLARLGQTWPDLAECAHQTRAATWALARSPPTKVRTKTSRRRPRQPASKVFDDTRLCRSA